MPRMLMLRQKLAATFAVVAVLAAIFTASALAASGVFQQRTIVGPYVEGKHTPTETIFEVQGEGFQYESCVDTYNVNFGEYSEPYCATKNRVAYDKNGISYGYGRVWNAKGFNNEIWGWYSG
jgi:hypothetical protein